MKDIFRVRQNFTFYLLASLLLFSSCNNEEDTIKTYSLELIEAYNLDLEVDNFIIDFQFLNDETLWIGTFNGGVYYVSGSEIINFNASNSPLPNNMINDIFIDFQECVWIATNEGFAKYDHGNWEVYTALNTPLTGGYVSEIAVNKKNEVLVGNGNATEGGLIFRNKAGTWKNYTTANSILPCSIIFEIELVESDNFWVSTGQLSGKGGVVKFENETITDVLNIENSGLLYNWIDNIEIDNGKVWFGYAVRYANKPGFPDGGIQRIDLKSNTIMDFLPNTIGLTSNRIISMKFNAATDRLWFATGLDDPYCENCIAGIGIVFENNNMIVFSALNNAYIEENSFFIKFNSNINGDMFVASEGSIYRLELLYN